MSVSPLLLLLLATLPALAGPAGPGGPSFAPRQQRAVAARAGDVAALECRVRGLADRAVSWVRSSDLQILTHAGAVFTADSRVSCSEASYDTELEDGEEFSGAGSQHTLRIERLRVGDSGRYECQVNTEPKMSLFYNLTVVESSLPRVVVRVVESGARGVSRVPAGGSARLSCEARYQPAAGSDLPDDVLAAMTPLRVTWTHEGEAIDPQSPRGGISLDTERWSGHVLSRLTLARTTTADAGRYWCGAGDVGAVMHLRVGDNKEYEPGDGEAEWMQRDQAVARVSGAGPLGPTTTSLLPVLPVLLLLSLNT